MDFHEFPKQRFERDLLMMHFEKRQGGRVIKANAFFLLTSGRPVFPFPS